MKTPEEWDRYTINDHLIKQNRERIEKLKQKTITELKIYTTNGKEIMKTGISAWDTEDFIAELCEEGIPVCDTQDDYKFLTSLDIPAIYIDAKERREIE